MAKRRLNPVPGGQPATLTSQVFERLREDILEGHFAPGEKLRIEGLQARYGVGASPVREALNRLGAVRLVEQLDQRGFRVRGLDEADFEELLRTRCWVNEIVVRESLALGDEAWEETLVLAYHRLWRCPPRQPSGVLNRDWELLHRRFHAALIAACPSAWLREFHEQLFDAADRYRRLTAPLLDAPALEATHASHRAIMEAAVQRDTARTVTLLNDAIRGLAHSVDSVAPFAAAPAGKPAAPSRTRPRRVA